jgi:O-antigen/teichoic acid export membrane protein
VIWSESVLLGKQNFLSNVLTLAGGTAFVQAIGFLSVPLLTRLYTPSDYGDYALYTAAFNLILPIVNLRYALAIMLPKEDQEALEVLRLCFRIAIFFPILLFAILFFSDLSFFKLHKIADNNFILVLICFSLFIGSATQAYSEWFNRMKSYFLMSLSRVGQVSGMVISQSLAGFFWGSNLLGLVLGHLLGNILGLGIFAKGNGTLKGKPLYFSPAAPLIRNMIRYKRFPLFTMGGSLLDGVSNYGTPLMLAMYFQSDMIGKYALAHMALSAPISLISQPIATVLYQRMSENINNGLEIKDLVSAILVRQFIIAVVIGATIFFFGPAIFGFLFGDNWGSAGQFAQILVPAMFFHFMASGLTTVLQVKERQDLLLYVQIFRAVITVISIMGPGIMGLNEIQLLTVYSFSRAAGYMVYLAFILKVARVF